MQSTRQALHTEDSGQTPSEIHKSEKQHRQGGDQGGTGERTDLLTSYQCHRKQQQQQQTQATPFAAHASAPAGVLH